MNNGTRGKLFKKNITQVHNIPNKGGENERKEK